MKSCFRISASAIAARRRLLITIALGSAGLLIAILVIVPLAVNLLLRSQLEQAMNRQMTHHRVRLGYAHFELLGQMLVLRDLTITQNAHPSPPIVHLGEARMSVEWFDLVRGHIVIDCMIIAPTVYLNAAQLQTEAATINLNDIWRTLLEAPNLIIKRAQVLSLNFAYAGAARRFEIEHVNLSAHDLRRTTLHISKPQAASSKVGPKAFDGTPALYRERRGAIGTPELLLSMAQFYFTIDTIRYRDITPARGYGLYFGGLAGQLFNMSNQLSGGAAQFELGGQFMGSGRTYAAGHILPLQASKDLELTFKVSGLQLRSLNALFRRYGHAEAAAGQLSVNSRVCVRADHISGFAAFLITELKIEAAGDKQKLSKLHEVFHSAIKGTAKLFSGPQPSAPPRIELSGSVDKAHSGLFGLLVLLGQKAFLNGFEPSFNHAMPESQ